MKKIMLSLLLCSMVVTANANDNNRKRAPQDPAFTQAMTECKKTAGIPERNNDSKEKIKITKSQRDVFNGCMKAKGFEKPEKVKQDPARKQAATECRKNAGIAERSTKKSKDKQQITQAQRESFDGCMKAKGFESRQRKAK